MDKASLGQYGVYQVASVLCRMEYTAVTTSRNTKAVDVLAFNPRNGKAVGIQVKTGRDRLPVVTKAPEEIGSLEFKNPFVFVYVPNDEKATLRYFILTGDKVKKLLEEQWDWHKTYRKHRKPIDEIGKNPWPWKFDINELEPYEDKWNLLGLD
ncbi:MAG: hypothetical protein ACE5IA_00590 [Dehalococcoidia bacterium]